MNVRDFSALGSLIRRTWTRKEGVILRLRSFGTQEPELLLCVGGLRNPELVASACVVWQEDDKLYDGPLDSADLRKLLSDTKVCYCEVTNARLLEHEAPGTFVCLLPTSKKPCSSACMLRTSADSPKGE